VKRRRIAVITEDERGGLHYEDARERDVPVKPHERVVKRPAKNHEPTRPLLEKIREKEDEK